MSKEPVRPAVWAVTIAVAFSYMGVGVVDPILPEISSALKAAAKVAITAKPTSRVFLRPMRVATQEAKNINAADTKR
jgi:hypothetical protein